jgi:pectinesterase
MSRQYYKNCYIQGDIDFIFGSATAVFQDCEIFSNRLGSGQSSFVTAPSTPEGEKYGYVFHNCCLTGDAEPQSVYLGRPWRDFAKSAFISCQLGAHISAGGWHNWDKPWSESTTEFAEYGCTGPGSANGTDFAGDTGTGALSYSANKNVPELPHSSEDHASGSGRVSWSRQLTAKEAEQYSIERVLSGSDGWRPWE